MAKHRPSEPVRMSEAPSQQAARERRGVARGVGLLGVSVALALGCPFAFGGGVHPAVVEGAPREGEEPPVLHDLSLLPMPYGFWRMCYEPGLEGIDEIDAEDLALVPDGRAFSVFWSSGLFGSRHETARLTVDVDAGRVRVGDRALTYVGLHPMVLHDDPDAEPEVYQVLTEGLSARRERDGPLHYSLCRTAPRLAELDSIERHRSDPEVALPEKLEESLERWDRGRRVQGVGWPR